jgi:hypothetical protein
MKKDRKQTDTNTCNEQPSDSIMHLGLIAVAVSVTAVCCNYRQNDRIPSRISEVKTRERGTTTESSAAHSTDDPFDFSGSRSASGIADTSAEIQDTEEYPEVTAEVFVRPDYVGVVLHPDTVDADEIGGLATVEKWTPTKADIDVLEERLHPYLLQLYEKMSKKDVDRAVNTFYRQYYGYITDNRKMVGVTLLSPALIAEVAEVNGETSIPQAMYYLTAGIRWVWDADFVCQQHFFDTRSKGFRDLP